MKHRVNGFVGIAALIVIGALVLVGTRLHDNQTGSRELLISRFQDRAEVVSALTQAVLGAAAATPEAGAGRTEGRRSAARRWTSGSRRAGSRTRCCWIESGEVISASRDARRPEARMRDCRRRRGVKAALAGTPVWLSDVSRGSRAKRW